MARRFEGLSDLEWQLFADIFPSESVQHGRGMPHAPFRKMVNTCSMCSAQAAAGAISPRDLNGHPKARRKAGYSVGKPMAPSPPCRPASWGLPRSRG